MPRVSADYRRERREEILRAAMAVFSRKGVKAATMADVAAEAGVSPGAIYRYFRSKEELARICMGVQAREAAERWRETVAAAPSPLEALLSLARGAFEAMRDEGEQSALIVERFLAAARAVDSPLADQVREERRTIEAAVRDAIERAQLAGELPAHVDPTQLAEALLAFYYGARLVSMTDPGWDPVVHLEALAELMRRSGH